MKNDPILLFGVLVIMAVAGVWFFFGRQQDNPALNAFAQCLADKDIVMYGAEWCPHCQNEKRAFGSAFQFVKYVECPDDPQRCIAAGIEGYPTWVLPDGRKLIGEQGLDKLANESGCILENIK